MELPKFTANDMYKFACVVFFCGAIYFKIDYACNQLKAVTEDLKESHSRIEKLELSVAEIKLRLDRLQYEQDKLSGPSVSRATGG